MTIETIRLSDVAKRQLLSLKRRTGIDQWNTLCRWGLCTSLTNSKPIVDPGPRPLSNVEMTWKVFAGRNDKLYLAILKMSYGKSRLVMKEISLTRYAQLHIERGVSLLATGETDLNSLLSFAA